MRLDGLVDIGVPTYRRTTYLAEAIESVLAQTLGRWRLTVCDNGSGGDDVQRVVEPYLSDPRISYVASGRELSLAENWTRAILEGTSPYVALLNDDDRWHRDYLGRRVDALDAHLECGFAFAEWVQVDEAGHETTRAPARFAEGVVSRERLAWWFTRQNIVVPPAVVVRRTAYEAVGAAFDGRWHYCDWEMWARLASRFGAYYLARCDSDYRRHGTTNTFATREQPDRLVEMVEHIEGLFMRELPDFRPGRLERRRNRSHILLHAACDVHQGAGWEASGPLYRRALSTYPFSVFQYVSLWMLGTTLLGRRGSRAVARVLRPLRERRHLWARNRSST